jgi:HlyD family secretion protein
MMQKKLSRRTVTLGAAALVALSVVFMMWPRPIPVDIGAAARQEMALTIDEEGRTRVKENYIVSAPVSGRLLRVDAHPGDPVEGQASVVARILPTNPSFLDMRAQTEAESAVRSAEAALVMARAEVGKADAERDYAAAEVARMRTLRAEGAVAQAALDRAELAMRSAAAQVRTAAASVNAREAELENAKARLITPLEAKAAAEAGADDAPGTLPVLAPVSGRILRVLQESETIVAAGTPLVEIGDPASDLEILAEYLSTDAVKIARGDRVVIEKWGGETPLAGVVTRVEPFGFTKYSALGVEEQRVNVIIDFVSPPEERKGLGHGFRVETQVVVWEDKNALTVPSSALFRNGGEWSVFAVEGGRARRRPVAVGRNNGVQAEILSGIEEGERVVLYPGAELSDGIQVTQRKIGE